MLTLVTGATGLVGNNVVRLLLDRGQQIRVLVRPTANPRALAGLDVETIAGDVQQPETVRAACRGVGRIVHAAAVVQFGWTGLEKQRAINVAGTRHVVAAAKAEGARLIHVSTVDTLGMGCRAAPGDEDSPQYNAVVCPYVITKREAERLVLDEVDHGLDAVVVNPTYMLGLVGLVVEAFLRRDDSADRPRLRQDRSAGRKRYLRRSGRCGGRYSRRIRSGPALRGRRYILGGDPMRLFDTWKLIAEIAGVKPPWHIGRRPLLRFYGRCGDLWGKIRGREGVFNSAAVESAMVDHHFSYARAQQELGYSPRPARKRSHRSRVELTVSGTPWLCESGGSLRIQSSRARRSAVSQSGGSPAQCHHLLTALRLADLARCFMMYLSSLDCCQELRIAAVMEKEVSDRVQNFHQRLVQLRDSL